MSRVLLVRHGQASFLAAEYDKLSPNGELQARALGAYWAAHGRVFDRACTGPRSRQRNTAAIVSRAYADAGVAFPDVVVMPEFDEYQAEDVVKQCLAPLVATDHGAARLYQAFKAATEPAEQHRTFQKVLEVLMERWVSGEIPAPGVESWAEFCERVNRGISHFLAGGARGERSVIFTSGGPIAVAAQRALHLTHKDALRLSWMSRNCSYSEFLSSGDRFSLSTFNAFPHLDDPLLLTYR
jgi:broad specificity phosphatase PhoE